VGVRGTRRLYLDGARRRFVGLDSLRGIAIVLILFGHYFFRLPDDTVGRPVLFAMRQRPFSPLPFEDLPEL